MVQSEQIVEPWDRLNGGWWLKPNLKNARMVHPDRPHWRGEVDEQHQGAEPVTRTRSYLLTTSSQRLRNEEVGPKAEGVTRIVALGDSVTHGWGVKRAESYPAQLESYLRGKGHQVEVINAGVPANQLPNMHMWCTRVAVDLDVDWVIWTRRPSPQSRQPTREYEETLNGCKAATGAKMLAVMPPISTFDVRGSMGYEEEERLLLEALGEGQPLLDLTKAFRDAQKGRGEILRHIGHQFEVVDQETGEVWLSVGPPRPPPKRGEPVTGPPMDPKLYALFEENPEVREALFFDDGHPDAEGFVLFAQVVGDRLIELFDAESD